VFKIIVFLIITSAVQGQSPDTLYPVRIFTTDGYKLGYINNEGVLKIKPLYAFAREFNSGRAFVKSDINSDIWLCLSTTGKTEFELLAKYVYDYKHDQAKVLSLDDSVYYIDLYGKSIEPVLITAPGSYVSLFPFLENGKYGYKGKADELVLPAIYEKAGEFSDGLAPVFIKFNESDLPSDNCYNAFINEKGAVILKAELKYDDKGFLESGYFYSPERWKNGVCRYYTSNDPLTRVEKYIRSDGKVIW